VFDTEKRMLKVSKMTFVKKGGIGRGNWDRTDVGKIELCHRSGRRKSWGGEKTSSEG